MGEFSIPWWSILLNIVWLIICPIIAAKKKRSVVGWIFGGLFLGLIGVIIVACLPEKDDE